MSSLLSLPFYLSPAAFELFCVTLDDSSRRLVALLLAIANVLGASLLSMTNQNMSRRLANSWSHDLAPDVAPQCHHRSSTEPHLDGIGPV